MPVLSAPFAVVVAACGGCGSTYRWFCGGIGGADILADDRTHCLVIFSAPVRRPRTAAGKKDMAEDNVGVAERYGDSGRRRWGWDARRRLRRWGIADKLADTPGPPVPNADVLMLFIRHEEHPGVPAGFGGSLSATFFRPAGVDGDAMRGGGGGGGARRRRRYYSIKNNQREHHFFSCVFSSFTTVCA